LPAGTPASYGRRRLSVPNDPALSKREGRGRTSGMLRTLSRWYGTPDTQFVISPGDDRFPWVRSQTRQGIQG
jgi:hypothetical protein